MSALHEHAQQYLRARRALGVKLERHGRLLPELVDYLESAGASTITRELAISWARLPARAHAQHWAARLSIARGFAAYLQTIDPATEVPPAGVFAVRYQRPTPYPWSDEDISQLLEATRALRPPLKAASYQTLFGLLAVTGMRLGEAIALERDAVDLDNGVITIREQTVKLERARVVPLHPTTADALERYAATRARLCPTQIERSSAHRAASLASGRKDAATLTTAVGLRTETVHPTSHHLRHSFAVRTLIGWQRSGVQIDEQIAVLSTYLGHVSPAETYWYLTATPELMRSAAGRLARHLGEQP